MGKEYVTKRQENKLYQKNEKKKTTKNNKKQNCFKNQLMP